MTDMSWILFQFACLLLSKADALEDYNVRDMDTNNIVIVYTGYYTTENVGTINGTT